MKNFEQQWKNDFLAILLAILVIGGICILCGKMGYVPTPVFW